MRKYLKYLFFFMLVLSPVCLADKIQADSDSAEFPPSEAVLNEVDHYLLSHSTPNKQKAPLLQLLDEIYQRLDSLSAEIEKMQTCKEICLNDQKYNAGT